MRNGEHDGEEEHAQASFCDDGCDGGYDSEAQEAHKLTSEREDIATENKLDEVWAQLTAQHGEFESLRAAAAQLQAQVSRWSST